MSSQAVELTGSARRWTTAVLMLATLMQAADATVVNVALPQLERSFGGGIALGAWVMTSYLCAAAVVAPMTGWLRRRFGPERLFHAAMALFLGGSLLCALAPSATAIILFRALQGAGGGVLPALAQAVLHDLHPRERHGKVLAAWGAAAMIGPILGPALGGIITDLASWRWVFLINLPLGLAAIWRVRGMLPRAASPVAAPFDLLGTLLLIAGIGALQLCLARGVGRSWLHSPELLAEGGIALAALIAMIVRRRRSATSVLRLDVFRDLNFAGAAFFNFVTSGLLFVTIVFLPALAQGPLGYPATVAGLTIVPRGIFMMLIMLAVGQIVGRIDYRFLLLLGSALTAAGLGLLAAGPYSLVWLVLGSTVQALGAGVILMPLSTFAFATLPVERRTDAAGLYSLLRQIGCASAVVLMTAILRREAAANLAGVAGPGGAAAGVAAYSACFEMMAVAALALVPAILLFGAPVAATVAAPAPEDPAEQSGTSRRPRLL